MFTRTWIIFLHWLQHSGLMIDLLSWYWQIYSSCVGDNLLTQLSSLYKPSEIENLSDRRDRIQSRLYTKMLNLLTEEEPNEEKEIWSTAATLFRQDVMVPCIKLKYFLDVRFVENIWRVRPPTSWHVHPAAPALTTLGWWCRSMKGESCIIISLVHSLHHCNNKLLLSIIIDVLPLGISLLAWFNILFFLHFILGSQQWTIELSIIMGSNKKLYLYR